MALPLTIDHAVIVVRDLDAAAARFRELGFTLTPRGFHSIGSQNHCIMFGSTYLELLAAITAHPWLDYYRAFGEGLAAIA
ncbi:MAG TPA: VOC family protein, partial [Gammaproteobacteria bacterium]|nr:VOC family protein [Gammaproteobacteria bacterium]